MKRQTNLNVISQERSGVFGLAILWIMLFHSSLRFDWPPLHLIKATGYCGVDVFLFLSGIGLYYSMENDPSPAHFYKKRALRVLLPYAVVAVFYEGGRCLLGHITPAETMANVTFVSYWRDGVQTYWPWAMARPYCCIRTRRPFTASTVLCSVSRFFSSVAFWRRR